MDVKVRVLAKRCCFASLDSDVENHIDVWVMSFGDKRKPNTGVEIEFTPNQLRALKKMLNNMNNTEIDNLEHFGNC